MLRALSSSSDLADVEKVLAEAVGNARSLDELEAWFKAQPGVKSVQQTGYLLKSHPPQRNFVVEFRLHDGSTVLKVVNFFELDPQRFQFRKLRDP
jgi:hypothetical protein